MLSRIPVYTSAGHLDDFYELRRVERLFQMHRVIVFRNRKGAIVRAICREDVEDGSVGAVPIKPTAHLGQRYSYPETLDSGRKAWTLKRFATADSSGDLFIRRIFRSAVLDNIVAA